LTHRIDLKEETDFFFFLRSNNLSLRVESRVVCKLERTATTDVEVFFIQKEKKKVFAISEVDSTVLWTTFVLVIDLTMFNSLSKEW
jgi:hypothetical protein